MTDTVVNEGAGGLWTISAPAGVTITTDTNSAGVATGLHITIDYTQTDFTNPTTGSIESIHFQGPVTDPNGPPPPSGQFYQGLAIDDTTVDIKNDLGYTINNYGIYLSDDSPAGTPDTSDPHPDNYAHMHGLEPTSLTDNSTGNPNATLAIYDPNFAPAAFGPPGSGVAPNFIFATGTIGMGHTEDLGGSNTGGGFTLHSEDEPGPTGGSFDLNFYVAGTLAAPNIYLTGTTLVGDHQGDGNEYVFSNSSYDTLEFGDDSSNAVHSIDAGIDPATGTISYGTETFGNITQFVASSLEITNGLTLDNAAIEDTQGAGCNFILDGVTNTINNGSTMTFIGSQGTEGSALTVNGLLYVGALGANTLGLQDEPVVRGTGAIIEQGENDYVLTDKTAPGFTFEVDGGVLNITSMADFQATIGPHLGGQTLPSIGIFGEVDVYDAFAAASAQFDTTTGVLSLYDASNNLMGNLHFKSDSSGLTLTTENNVHGQYLAINDHPGGVGGNVPIGFHS